MPKSSLRLPSCARHAVGGSCGGHVASASTSPACLRRAMNQWPQPLVLCAEIRASTRSRSRPHSTRWCSRLRPTRRPSRLRSIRSVVRQSPTRSRSQPRSTFSRLRQSPTRWRSRLRAHRTQPTGSRLKSRASSRGPLARINHAFTEIFSQRAQGADTELTEFNTVCSPVNSVGASCPPWPNALVYLACCEHLSQPFGTTFLHPSSLIPSVPISVHQWSANPAPVAAQSREAGYFTP